MAQNIYSESTPNLQKKGRKTGANLREQVRDPEEQEGKKEKEENIDESSLRNSSEDYTPDTLEDITPRNVYYIFIFYN